MFVRLFVVVFGVDVIATRQHNAVYLCHDAVKYLLKNITLCIMHYTLCIILLGCDKTLHESDALPPDNSQSAFTIALNTIEVRGKPLNDVHIYFFNEADMLSAHNYYPKMTDLALDRLLMESGHYTIFAIINTEEGLMPTTRAEVPNISFPNFMLWVKSLDAQYPDLLTGMVRYEVKDGIKQVTIDIKDGSGAVAVTTVPLNLDRKSVL